MGNEAEPGAAPKHLRERIPHWRLLLDHGVLTDEILNHAYSGSGTEEDPYAVTWIPNDPRNPMLWPKWQKWTYTLIMAVATMAVALVSSAYTGGVRQFMVQFDIGTEVATLGVSLFVLGFALGPLFWAPMSELWGRQILYCATFCGFTVFNAACTGSKNAASLIIFRFFAGSFGSSPLTNAGGVIADLFPASERGIAMSLFAAAPSLGPVLGPIIGGFLGMTEGWKWLMGLLAIFSGFMWIVGSLVVPETYAPVLLRRRAAALSKVTGKVYRSKIDIDKGGQVSVRRAFAVSLYRPWLLLFVEPIVLILSIYLAIIYGTLYMLFAAFPIVYEEKRGWNQGVGGLAFLGVLVGEGLGILWSIYTNKHYIKVQKKHNGFAPPEARLPVTIIASVLLPAGLFWFAWTNAPSVHFMASIAAGVFFGAGLTLCFLGIMNYLVDAYTIFAASVLAANSVLRSLFGMAFPLFTTYMYQNLGIHWASSIPAFLALACVPFPLLFYKYGHRIRKYCKFASESDKFMRTIIEQTMQARNQQQASIPQTRDSGETQVQSNAGTPPAQYKEEERGLDTGDEEKAIGSATPKYHAPESG
ncbi:hypothetical protein MPDQ_002398 [Monascus purpureus]|uniref:Major facilitator superfamily (MFS) profile domain-containing protein n=1 Tax=Monascus purpureus TaxID=5098 RepID=A0A507QKN8_MONPU|nr:hypothetical protein MPDQ_002398 [Monascus purpureus]BDD62996.1 hypothetical protein MAP00_007947 [Monascus purpureus]